MGCIFQVLSKADTVVKNEMAQVQHLHEMFEVLPHLEPEATVEMLKAIKNLSMEPSISSEPLQLVGPIPKLVQLFSKISHGDYGDYANEVSNEVMSTLYNLCRINKTRQEQAAQAGIVPHLKAAIIPDHHNGGTEPGPRAPLALPMLCAMALSMSRLCRAELYKHDGVQFFIKLMQHKNWQAKCLEAIAACLNQYDLAKVEPILLDKANNRANISTLTAVFYDGGPELYESFLKILESSNAVNEALGSESHVITKLKKIGEESNDAHARVNLIKMLQAIYKCHGNPKQLISQHALTSLVEEVSMNDKSSEIVKEIAKKLLRAFEIQKASP